MAGSPNFLDKDDDDDIKVAATANKLKRGLGRFLLMMGIIGFTGGGVALGLTKITVIGAATGLFAGMLAGGIALLGSLALAGLALLLQRWGVSPWITIGTGALLLTTGGFAIGYSGLIAGSVITTGLVGGFATGGIGFGVALLAIAIVFTTLYFLRQKAEAKEAAAVTSPHATHSSVTTRSSTGRTYAPAHAANAPAESDNEIGWWPGKKSKPSEPRP